MQSKFLWILISLLVINLKVAFALAPCAEKYQELLTLDEHEIHNTHEVNLYFNINHIEKLCLKLERTTLEERLLRLIMSLKNEGDLSLPKMKFVSAIFKKAKGSYLSNLYLNPKKVDQVINNYIRSVNDQLVDQEMQYLAFEKFLGDQSQQEIANEIISESFVKEINDPNGINKIEYVINDDLIKRLDLIKSVQSIEPKSLLESFIKDTKAHYSLVKFRKGPSQDNHDYQRFGQTKLLVQIKRESIDSFRKYFSREEFFYHYHSVAQGTLNTLHKGNYGSYGKHGNPLAFRSNTLLPAMIFSTSEGERLTNYFKLRMVTTEDMLRPWVISNFCGKGGGYDSCTHWIGDIPVGEVLVKQYTFPGKVDRHARRDVEVTQDGIVFDIKPYDKACHSFSNMHEDVSRCWKAKGRANMQLWEVLGDREGQVGGYFANPGYLLYRLTAHVSNSRIPIVFYMSDSDSDFSKKFSYDSFIEAH
jgi:hypothetical protein